MTARLLVIMGSGETAPTMVKVHRAVVAAAGAELPGVLLDTPFGFQANADDLSARAVAYFDQSVGAALEVAGARAAEDLAGRAGEAVAARLAAAPFVFSGPGSPTYALGVWRGSLVPGLVADKLRGGGAVVFSSAAALTLGTFTVPVYEIYKVGEPPRWESGLDLLRTVDPRLHVAVVPHFDNTEGGSHDTRFCYLGEHRLARLQAELPDDAWVLGVDEHTALVADLDAGRVEVTGIGGVTVRVAQRAEVLASGSTGTVEELLSLPAALRRRIHAAGAPRSGPPDPGRAEAVVPASVLPGGAATAAALSPLLRATRHHQAAFAEARVAGDAPGMVDAVLALEEELWAWRADPTQSDEQDRARAVLRAMVAQLGEVAEVGTRDPAAVVGPFVELALGLRATARTDRRFADADTVRDRLLALGVEVRDTPDGTDWAYRAPRPATG